MQVFGLVGNPVGHSLSPPMHEAAYAATGIDARYVAFEPARGALGPAIDGAEALGITGLNVTIPFKQHALEHVEADELAARIGAVNTIDFSRTPRTGHNTDAAGVRRSFEHHGVALDGMTALVLGAGGAGRAAAFALADEGARVRIVNRTPARARDLAEAIADASGHPLDDLEDLVPETDVIINATSVGMDEDRSPVPTTLLRADLVVMDAVYQPLETRLLREANAAGATTIDGGWMLLFQGAEAFELWTGAPAPIEAMNEALRARL